METCTVNTKDEESGRTNGKQGLCEKGRGGGRMKEYVLREDVLRCVEEDGHDCELDLGYYDHNLAFQEIIKDIPAADVVEVRHAYWRDIQPPDQDNNVQCWCSACGAGELHADGMIVPYCWKCGAKMDGERKGGDE